MIHRCLQFVAIALCAAGLLSSCSSSLAPVEEGRRGTQATSELPDSYVVTRGDTLYVIAWRYGLSHKELAAWNNLASPDRIYAGQRLRLKPPGAVSTASGSPPITAMPPKPAQLKPDQTAKLDDTVQSNTSTRVVGQRTWAWPTDGKVVSGYQPDIPGHKGIQIGGKLGQPVRAASPGEVVYSGSGLPGYGRLIIVKHSDSLLSAYGYLGKIFVKEGDKVETGQSIAELGSSSENAPILHFEIRQNGKPINPFRFLPVNGVGGQA